MKEIRRRTRVVGAFPDGQSCLNLTALTAAPHCRNRLVPEMLHEHATTLSAADHANRSLADKSGHF